MIGARRIVQTVDLRAGVTDTLRLLLDEAQIALISDCIGLTRNGTQGFGSQFCRSPGTAAFVPFIGAGSFPRAHDPERDASSAAQMLLGAAVEIPVRQSHLMLSISRAFLPVACSGGCARGGWLADASMLFGLLGKENTDAVLSAGPTIGHSTFGGSRTPLGVAVSAGAPRGVGPRFVLRYTKHLSKGSPGSIAGWMGCDSAASSLDASGSHPGARGVPWMTAVLRPPDHFRRCPMPDGGTKGRT